MHRGHAGRVRAGDSALFDVAHCIFERTNGGVSITRVDVTRLLTAEDLVDLLQCLVSKSRAGVDRRGDRLAFGRRLPFTRVHESRGDVALFVLISHYVHT